MHECLCNCKVTWPAELAMEIDDFARAVTVTFANSDRNQTVTVDQSQLPQHLFWTAMIWLPMGLMTFKQKSMDVTTARPMVLQKFHKKVLIQSCYGAKHQSHSLAELPRTGAWQGLSLLPRCREAVMFGPWYEVGAKRVGGGIVLEPSKGASGQLCLLNFWTRKTDQQHPRGVETYQTKRSPNVFYGKGVLRAVFLLLGFFSPMASSKWRERQRAKT